MNRHREIRATDPLEIARQHFGRSSIVCTLNVAALDPCLSIISQWLLASISVQILLDCLSSDLVEFFLLCIGQRGLSCFNCQPACGTFIHATSKGFQQAWVSYEFQVVPVVC